MKKLSDDQMTTEVKPLVHKLATFVEPGKPSIFTFIAARSDEGTTTVTRMFADALHAETGKKVLLIEARPPGKNPAAKPGLVEATASGAAPSTVLATGAGVQSCLWASSDASSAQSNKLIQDQGFWRTLQGMFDFILIDAPALNVTSDGISFARASNAAVLVVAAESTRKQVVENLRDTLTAGNAVIAGVVLNKRRFYIPEKIYNRL